jgi:hypothetical protein
MATGSLYGSVSESTGLYGIGAASGGTYFEWFIFQDSLTAPATPTGGSWSFSTNIGTPPTGWVVSPPPAPVNQVWVSIAVVDTRSPNTFTWSVPGLMAASGLPILSASGVPSAGTGSNGQLYINTATTPQGLYFKQSGAWTQLTGSNFVDLINNQTIGGVKTFSQTIQGNISGTAANVTGTVAVANGGTGATTAGDARTNLGLGTIATQSASAVAITGGSITGITDLAVADGGTGASTAAQARVNLDAVGLSDTQTLTNKTINAANNTLSNIPNSALSNSSVTINGTPVSLGTAIAVTAETPNELIFSTGLSATSAFDGSQETTVSLQAVGTAGVYGSAGTTPQITVNTVGQVTDIIPLDIVITTNNVSGSIAIAQGGTGASAAKFAMQNLLPDYAGNNGKSLVLAANGTDLEWKSVAGVGTVTSVDGSGGSTGLTLTGGPITAAGTLTLGGTLAIASGGTNAVNATDARTNLGLGSAAVLDAGVALGVATLDGGGTVPTSQLPAAVLGAVKYQGTWNASTNTPTLTSSVGSQGHYYVVNVAGSTDLNGITDWKIGDWAIYNGSIWEKIDNTDAVTSVNGYTGTVVLNSADVGAVPTTRTITAGTGLTGGGDLSADRTLSIDNTAVTSGSYGSASAVGTFTVNAQGQLTAASNTTIAITNTQVSGLGTMSTQNANSVAITGGSINGTTIGATTPSTVTGTTVTATTLVVNDNSTLGSSNSDTVSFNARVNSDIDPSTNNAYDLGRNSHAWRNLYLTGTANIAALTASGAVTLNGGTANGVAYLNGSKVLTTGSALTFDGGSFNVAFANGTNPRIGARFNGSNARIGFGVANSNGYAYLGYNVNDVVGSDGQTYDLSSQAVSQMRMDNGTFIWNRADAGTAGAGVSWAEQMRLTATGLGIGKSSPATKLDVKGAATSGTTVDVALFAGGVASTTGSGAKIYLSDGGTARSTYISGFSLDGSTNAHALSFGVSAGFAAPAEGMRLTSTGLGIGTSSPTQKLTVSTSASDVASFVSGDTNADIYFKASGTTLGNTRLRATGGDLVFITGLNDRMRLDSSGNLGLGVTPSAWGTGSSVRALQLTQGAVWGFGAANMYLGANNFFNGTDRIYLSGNTAGEYRITGNIHAWMQAAVGTAGNAISFTQAMTLDASGKLQLNTTSTAGGYFTLNTSAQPGLDIYRSDVDANYDGIRFRNTTNTTTYGSLGWDSTGLRLDANAGTMYFSTSNTERARIDSSGNLLVGTTSNPTTNRVNISWDNATVGGMRFSPSSSSYNQSAIEFYDNGSTRVGFIYTTGSATTYSTSSDYRLKNTIAPMTGALARVAALKPCTYKWNADGSDGEGFIAHELAEVVPQCVTGQKDAVDAEGKPQYQGIDTSFLVATLTAAIQELKAEFDAYKASHP